MHVSQSPELRFDLKQQAAIQPTQLETATQILPASEGQTRSTPYKHKYTPLFYKCQHVPNTLASFNMSWTMPKPTCIITGEWLTD